MLHCVAHARRRKVPYFFSRQHRHAEAVRARCRGRPVLEDALAGVPRTLHVGHRQRSRTPKPADALSSMPATAAEGDAFSKVALSPAAFCRFYMGDEFISRHGSSQFSNLYERNSFTLIRAHIGGKRGEKSALAAFSFLSSFRRTPRLDFALDTSFHDDIAGSCILLPPSKSQHAARCWVIIFSTDFDILCAKYLL